MKYDYLIVGCGLFGSAFARLATDSGKSCLLIDKRSICFEIVEINPCLDNKQNKMAETAFRILENATAIIEKRG